MSAPPPPDLAALWRFNVPFLEVWVRWGERGLLSWPGGSSNPAAVPWDAFLCWKALFRSLERLEKEKANKEDLVLGIDVVWPWGVLAPPKGVLGRVTNTPCALGAQWQNWPGGGRISRLAGAPSPGASVFPWVPSAGVTNPTGVMGRVGPRSHFSLSSCHELALPIIPPSFPHCSPAFPRC